MDDVYPNFNNHNDATAVGGLMLEEAKCHNCGGPIVPDGSLYRCQYCKATYFPPTETEVKGGELSTVTTTALPLPAARNWSTASSHSRMYSYIESWSTMSTRLPLVPHGYRKRNDRGQWILGFFEEIFLPWLCAIVVLVGSLVTIIFILGEIF